MVWTRNAYEGNTNSQKKPKSNADFLGRPQAKTKDSNLGTQGGLETVGGGRADVAGDRWEWKKLSRTFHKAETSKDNDHLNNFFKDNDPFVII